MVELKLEAVDFTSDMSIPKDTYVAIRVGESQKLSRLAQSRDFKFSDNVVGDRRFGKIDIFKRIGTASISIKHDSETELEEVDVPCREGEKMKFRVFLSSKEAREKPPNKETSNSVSEAKNYLAEHNLEMRLAEAMQACLREKPADPANFIAGKLKENQGSNRKIVSKLDSKEDSSAIAPLKEKPETTPTPPAPLEKDSMPPPPPKPEETPPPPPEPKETPPAPPEPKETPPPPPEPKETPPAPPEPKETSPPPPEPKETPPPPSEPKETPPPPSEQKETPPPPPEPKEMPPAPPELEQTPLTVEANPTTDTGLESAKNELKENLLNIDARSEDLAAKLRIGLSEAGANGALQDSVARVEANSNSEPRLESAKDELKAEAAANGTLQDYVARVEADPKTDPSLESAKDELKENLLNIDARTEDLAAKVRIGLSEAGANGSLQDSVATMEATSKADPSLENAKDELKTNLQDSVVTEEATLPTESGLENAKDELKTNLQENVATVEANPQTDSALEGAKDELKANLLNIDARSEDLAAKLRIGLSEAGENGTLQESVATMGATPQNEPGLESAKDELKENLQDSVVTEEATLPTESGLENAKDELKTNLQENVATVEANPQSDSTLEGAKAELKANLLNIDARSEELRAKVRIGLSEAVANGALPNNVDEL